MGGGAPPRNNPMVLALAFILPRLAMRAQRGQVTRLRAHSPLVAGLGFEPSNPAGVQVGFIPDPGPRGTAPSSWEARGETSPPLLG